jgi:hypothetical protein
MARISWVVMAWLACGAAAHAQITGVEGRVPPPTEADWNRIIGSFHVRLCRRHSTCLGDDDPEVIATFFVSVGRHAMVLDTASKNFALAVGGAGSPRDRNACYASERVRVVHSSYAGQIGVGAFEVQPRSDTPVIPLVLGGSVDAFYIADVVVQDGHMEGIGHSEGLVDPTAAWPKDTIVGTRIGPPNTGPCFDAARAVMAKWRSR